MAAASLSILRCPSLLSHLSLPSLHSSPSLAPALLMIPRQEAELAWGSKVIFPPLLCHFLLFVTGFHWNVQAEKNQLNARTAITISSKLSWSFTQTSEAWKETDLNINTMVILANRIAIKRNYKTYTIVPPLSTTSPLPSNSPQACVCLCRASVSSESLEGIYKATGRLKHVWPF